jgi:dihydropyrimidinase
MADRIVFAGGTVVTADGVSRADVLVEGQTIRSVGSLGEVADARVVDARGKLVLPGGVDVHTHLDTPFMGTVTSDDHVSGSVAALMGGTTTYIDFAFQQPGERLPETLESWHAKAAGRSVADYAFHLAIADPYTGFLDDLPAVVADGAPSIKVFMAYKGLAMLDDGQLYSVFRAASRLGANVCVHAENGPLIDALAAEVTAKGRTGPVGHLLSRPPVTEVEAVERAITIAELADAPIYFVHLSTAGAAAALARARAEGRPVSGETCTHYLLLDEEEYHRPGFEAAKYVVSPPLRGAADRAAMWDALREGTIGVVSSDHCPFCFAEQKELGRDDFRQIPNGAPGVEHRVPLLYGHGVRAKRLDLEQLVRVACTEPARAFGLYPRKGTIAPGSDADLVVVDPDASTVILAEQQHQRSDYTPFERWSVPGRIVGVWRRGEHVVDRGRFIGRDGGGVYLARRPVA